MLTDNYIPEMNANARIFSELAELWSGQDEEVTVITSQPNFPKGKIFAGFQNQWMSQEEINQVNVLRVKTYMHANKGVFRRTLDFISFGISSFICGLFQPKADVIVAVTPQFFCGISGCLLALIKRTPLVLVVCDLWPDSIVSNGIIKKNWLYRVIKSIECWMYRRACSIVVLSENFIHYLSELGVPDEKIMLSIAGASRHFYPREKNRTLLERYHMSNQFVVGSIGTFGASHNHEDILSVAHSLQNSGNENICFFMIGDGIKREPLARAAQNKLDHCIIDGPFRGDEIPEYWSVADVALIPLAPTETNKTVLPSKMIEAMAMGIPVILYAPDGEARRFLSRSRSGWFVPAGDQIGLGRLLLELEANRQLVLHERHNTVEFAKKFTRERQAQELLEHLMLIQSEGLYEKV